MNISRFQQAQPKKQPKKSDEQLEREAGVRRDKGVFKHEDEYEAALPQADPVKLAEQQKRMNAKRSNDKGGNITLFRGLTRGKKK